MLSVVGLSLRESKKFLEHIRKSLFQEKYIYRHKYQTDNDLLIFDNTITLHNREGQTKDRLAFRIPNDYSNLREDYNPYIQEPYKADFKRINIVMPTYDFENTETGEVFEEMMSISAREQYLKDNPHIRQLVSGINIVSGVAGKSYRQDSGWKDNLSRIAEHTHKVI